MSSLYGSSRNNVLVEEPHQSSMAALVMLTNELGKAAVQGWLDFRDAFFDKNEPLVCMWCGKKDLVREVPDRHNKEMMKRLATVEHIVPRAKGIDEYDEDNLGIACFPCNNKRGDSWGA